MEEEYVLEEFLDIDGAERKRYLKVFNMKEPEIKCRCGHYRGWHILKELAKWP